jgi:hypothetical protein
VIGIHRTPWGAEIMIVIPIIITGLFLEEARGNERNNPTMKGNLPFCFYRHIVRPKTTTMKY